MPSAAISTDCSSFMTDTTTLAPLTETTFVTTTISPAELLLRQLRASQNGLELVKADSVPSYAWPCDVERYAEVCSCMGHPAATITELAWTAIETITMTRTQTLSGSPVFQNLTRSLASSWQFVCPVFRAFVKSSPFVCASSHFERNKRHFQQLLAEHWKQSLLDAINVEV
ncbi:uncharacterized protein BKA78DRAFT_351097 [Phyllosticta capitalensis]|uniref:uncharacterized protein n=1 Tax=Phyllosticta capitalensis TaxID=121624 RepID=UPI003131F47B